MAVDPVGASLGVLGLAGLFTVCVDCFDYVQSGRKVGKTFLSYHDQFDHLRLRLYAWGKAVKLTDPTGYDPRLNDPKWHRRVQDKLSKISLLFLDGNKIVKKYQLNENYDEHDQTNYQFIHDALSDFIGRVKETRKRAGFLGASRWSLKHKKEFKELLDELKDAVDSLDWVAKNLDLFSQPNQVLPDMTKLQLVPIASQSRITSSTMPTKPQSRAALQSPAQKGDYLESFPGSSPKGAKMESNVKGHSKVNLGTPESTSPIPSFSISSAKVGWNVPFDRNKRFTARDEEMCTLESSLFEQDRCSRVAIYGLGGVGKTQIALELAYRIRHTRPACSVFWVPATDIDAFQSAYEEIARQLGIPLGVQVNEAVKSHLSREEAGEWLLLIDNADQSSHWYLSKNSSLPESEKFLSDYLPRSYKGSIVMTTRNREVAMSFSSSAVLEVTELSPASSVELMQRLLSVSPRHLTNKDQLEILVERLEYLPLAISQAAAYINQKGIAAHEYTGLLVEQEEEVIELLSEDFQDEGRYRSSRNPIASTWIISFEEIRAANPRAADYLCLMACVEAKDIPIIFLPEPKTKKEQLDSLGVLQSYSFVKSRTSDEAVDLHRLVHLATRNWLRIQDAWNKWLIEARDRMSNIFPDYDLATRSLSRGLLPHAQNIVRSLQDDFSELLLNLMERIGRFLHNDGQYWSSEQLWKDLNARQKSKKGSHHIDTLRSLVSLANSLYNLGRFEEAEEAAMFAFKILYVEHKSIQLTIEAGRAQGSCMIALGKHNEAEALLLQLLSLCDELTDNCSSETFKCKMRLADVKMELDKNDEAEEISRFLVKAVKEQEGIVSKDQELRILEGMAESLIRQGKVDEAELWISDVLSLAQTEFGTNHQITLISMKNCGVTLNYARKYDRALPILEEAYHISLEKFPHGDYTFIMIVDGLATSLAGLGRQTESWKLLHDSLEVCRKEVQEKSPIGIIIYALALIYKSQGRDEEALEFMKEGHRQLLNFLGPFHWRTKNSLEFMQLWSRENC